MGTFNARLHGDQPITYEALGAVIKGSQLVIPASGTTSDPTLQGMAVAGDAAKNCLGVCEQDCVPVSLRAGYETGGTAGYDSGITVIDASVPGATSAVYDDVVGYVTYAAAVAYNAKLACAAAGQVRAWVTGDGPDAIVGACKQPGGVAAAGVALARIRLP